MVEIKSYLSPYIPDRIVSLNWFFMTYRVQHSIWLGEAKICPWVIHVWNFGPFTVGRIVAFDFTQIGISTVHSAGNVDFSTHDCACVVVAAVLHWLDHCCCHRFQRQTRNRSKGDHESYWIIPIDSNKFAYHSQVFKTVPAHPPKMKIRLSCKIGIISALSVPMLSRVNNCILSKR